MVWDRLRSINVSRCVDCLSRQLCRNLTARMQFMTQALSELAVIPGATHLFEEPGTLEKVAQIAGHWLVKHLSEAKSPA